MKILVVMTGRVTFKDVNGDRVSFSSALAWGRIRTGGPPVLARGFQAWGGLSHYAGVRPVHPRLDPTW